MSLKQKPVPKEIRCKWVRRKSTFKDIYDCRLCGSWTGYFALYREAVCPSKERRKSKDERRQRRWP